MMITRRQLIKTTIAGTAISILPRSLLWAEEAKPIQLKAISKIIEINKKPAKIFTLESNIPYPFTLAAPGRFYVRLTNKLADHTLIHWHGLTPPPHLDGVPELSQAALKPDQSFLYDFPLDEQGTDWMHSHVGLPEQNLLAAPLIIQPQQPNRTYREVVLFLQDFIFADAEEVLKKLQSGEGPHAHHQGMNMGISMAHLHDLEPDAFLANQRTLDDPEVVMLENGETIRLRVINAAATTNFLLDLGGLHASVIAVDVMDIKPVSLSVIDLAIAQRLDILVSVPKHGGVFPILAKREGEKQQTGLILATKGQSIAKISTQATVAARPVGTGFEEQLQALKPLPNRTVDRDIKVLLGEDHNYQWSIYEEGKPDQPIQVKLGQRVRMQITNKTSMAHPIHLHGHRFQVTQINNKNVAGAVRDTLWIPVGGRANIIFDANNFGKWAFHCHHLYHMMAGMMTTLVYEGA